MSAPMVKGWCPGAHRPMMSGDGLVVRIRPRLGRLSAGAASLLCDLAEAFGNGVIDVTTRANLQIRGVDTSAHPALLNKLIDAGLVDADPVIDARRNIVATPFWQPDDLTDRLGQALDAALPSFPDMPAKIGYALDTGPATMLREVSADFRIETGGDTPLILRADGADRGVPVTEESAIEALAEMVDWFIHTGGAESGRMARHLMHVPALESWTAAPSRVNVPRITPGGANGGYVFGVSFGQCTARKLASLVEGTGASHVRLTPWRMLFLEGASLFQTDDFIAEPDDPLLTVSACSGAPHCPQASVPTRELARALAPFHLNGLHVSGCAKGCALQKASALTIVGCDGVYDVVRDGRAGDVPVARGLSQDEIRRRFAQ